MQKWKKWRPFRFRNAENSSVCGRFENEHQIFSAETPLNEQTSVLTCTGYIRFQMCIGALFALPCDKILREF